MGKAILNMTIDGKEIILYKDNLASIDKLTSSYKNANELKQNESIIEKASQYGSNLKNSEFSISYLGGYKKKTIKPLFNDNMEIILTDDLFKNRVSETEKARKLLFNSKKQIFSRAIYKSNSINDTLNIELKLTEDEKNVLLYSGLEVFEYNYRYYVSIKELVKYRITHSKLGIVRPIYENALDAWKKEIVKLNEDELYFYSRELRILLNDYINYTKNLTVKNLKVEDKIDVLKDGYIINHTSNKKIGKFRVIKKTIESNY